MKKLLSISMLLLTLGLAACERDISNDAFAQCIADSGAKFYGAFWCPHCADQKKEFGDSKDLLPYVECAAEGKNANVAACAAAGVDSYPTWIFADGTRVEGPQTFEELSEATACPLPGEESILLRDQ